MVVRSALVVAALALSVLSFPSATAENTAAGQVFYLTADLGTSPTPVAAYELPMGWRLPGTGNLRSLTTYWQETLDQGGMVAPVSSHFWIEVTAPTVIPPAPVGAADVCPMKMWMQIMDVDDAARVVWTKCVGGLGSDGVLQPGTYEVEIDWSDAEPESAEAGEKLWFSLYSQGSSAPPAQSLYFIADDKDHPASMTWSGTSEPMPGSDSAPATNTNSTTNSTATSTSGAPGSSGPSSTGTTGPTATSTAAPKPGEQGTESKAAPVREDAKKSPAAIGMLHGALLIAGFAILMRRRTA